MKILIVEDDLEISKLLADFLQGNGYEVLCQYDGLHVLDCIQEHQIDLILLETLAHIFGNVRSDFYTVNGTFDYSFFHWRFAPFGFSFVLKIKLLLDW